MVDGDWLAARFEEHRAHLRGVAYRMLGSTAEADDAVQNSWLRLSRTDTGDIENLAGWLTTVVARECLNMLRARRAHREQSLGDTVVELAAEEVGSDPEADVLLADSIGPALMVVLDSLSPAERLAFVLHDVFAVPFDEIAAILDRSPVATRQLASRARRRVHGATPQRTVDVARQRRVVDAFLAAIRDGDFGGLLAILDPDVVLRDRSAPLPRGAAALMHGADAVASHALTFRHGVRFARPALVEGTVGVGIVARDRTIVALAIRYDGDAIAEIEVVTDAERLRHVDLAALDDTQASSDA
jgi:RNA polymerase sigma-70 factor (ECF subfamily)